MTTMNRLLDNGIAANVDEVQENVRAEFADSYLVLFAQMDSVQTPSK